MKCAQTTCIFFSFVAVLSMGQLSADFDNMEYYFKRKKSDNSALNRHEASEECTKTKSRLADLTSEQTFHFVRKKLDIFEPPRTGGEHLYHVALYRDVASGIFYWGDGSRLLASLYAKLRRHDIRNTTKNCGYVVISRTAAMQFAIEDCDGVSSGFICQRIANNKTALRILSEKQLGEDGSSMINKRHAGSYISPPSNDIDVHIEKIEITHYSDMQVGGPGSGSGSGSGVGPQTSTTSLPFITTATGLIDKPTFNTSNFSNGNQNIINKNITIIQRIEHSGLIAVAIIIVLLLIVVSVLYTLERRGYTRSREVNNDGSKLGSKSNTKTYEYT